jgi:hypothetical protein
MAFKPSSEQEQKSWPPTSESEAVRRMIKFAEKKAVKLPPGEKVKDLVHEGHHH